MQIDLVREVLCALSDVLDDGDPTTIGYITARAIAHDERVVARALTAAQATGHVVLTGDEYHLTADGWDRIGGYCPPTPMPTVPYRDRDQLNDLYLRQMCRDMSE